MPETATLSPSEIRLMWAAVKSGELSMDDVQRAIPKLDAKSAELVRKSSPIYMTPPAETSKGFMGELKHYGHELASGEGPARAEVADAASRFGKSVATNLNPLAIAKSFVDAVETKPQREADWGAGKRSGPTLSELRDDPSKLATVISPENLGALATLPVAESIRIGGNRIGTALATSEKAQNAANLTAGTAVGAIGAKSIGMSPWIGGVAGRNMFKGSPLPRIVGEGLEKVTGGRQGAVADTIGGFTAEEKALLAKEGMTPEQIQRLDAIQVARRAPQPSSATTGARPPSPPPTSPVAPTSGSAPTGNVSPGPSSPAPPTQPTAGSARMQPPAPMAPSALPDAFRPLVRTPAPPRPQTFTDFMYSVDQALEGAPSKSKARSGFRHLSENDAITASNAFAAGVRDPQQVIQAILEKRKNRQADHIGDYYQGKREKPE